MYKIVEILATCVLNEKKNTPKGSYSTLRFSIFGQCILFHALTPSSNARLLNSLMKICTGMNNVNQITLRMFIIYICIMPLFVMDQRG